MFEPKFVNPRRRDLLKQLLALGAVGPGMSALTGNAQETGNLASAGLNAYQRGSSQYDALRKISLWRSNLPERYPDVIVQAGNEQDIRDALAFARENDLQIACGASGHNTAGAPLRNGGMLLFISGLSGIEIDAAAKTATIQPAINTTTMFAAVEKLGLDFPTANCASVALGGYILGGGFGRNMNFLAEGPYCKALISAEVMLANGEIVSVDEDNHPDIYWAMRGCGPAFFGIVTSMTLGLFDPPGAYLASRYGYPIDALPSLLEFFDSHQAEQDPQVSISLGIQAHSDDPDELHAIVSLDSFAVAGTNAVSEARQRLEYYVDAGLAKDAISRSEFVSQNPVDYMFTRDRSTATHTDNIYTDDSFSLIPAVELFRSRPQGLDVRLVLSHNAQMHAPYGDDIAFTAGGRHFLSIYVDWSDRRLDSLAYEWTDRFSQLAKPFASGHYLNQIDTGVYPKKVRASFSATKWERLSKIRSKYDPDNRFFTYVGHEA